MGLDTSLLNNLRQIAPNILNYNNSQITQVLLYGDTSFKNETNTNILKSTISYLLATKKFDSTVSGDCDFLCSCVNYEYRKNKNS